MWQCCGALYSCHSSQPAAHICCSLSSSTQQLHMSYDKASKQQRSCRAWLRLVICRPLLGRCYSHRLTVGWPCPPSVIHVAPERRAAHLLQFSSPHNLTSISPGSTFGHLLCFTPSMPPASYSETRCEYVTFAGLVFQQQQLQQQCSSVYGARCGCMSISLDSLKSDMEAIQIEAV